MRTKLLVFIVCLCLVPARALRAEEGGRKAFALSLFTGIQTGLQKHQFVYSYSDKEMKASFAYGFGISYGDISLFHSAKLLLSSEVTVFSAETDPIDAASGGEVDAQFRYSGIPLLLIAELHQSGPLGPFVKLGLGAVHNTIDEEYYDQAALDLHSDYWCLAFASGAGVRYCPNSRLDILFTWEGFFGTDNGKVENSAGYSDEGGSIFAFDFLGVRIRYWF
jgi:opacity protein-like surface antigen